MLSTGQWWALLGGVILLVAVVFAWRFCRRYGFNAMQLLLYLVQWPLTRFYWRTKYQGRWPLSHEQGAICVCNHTSGVDPLFIQRAMPKMARWMVAREYFTGLMGWFLRQSTAIPVRRGGADTAATKMAIRHAQSGGIVGMLPEGRINVGEEILLPGRPGVALVAIKAQVPIVPCWVEGIPYFGSPLSSFRKPARVRVVIGEPIDVSAYGQTDDKAVLGEITLRCLKEIAVLSGHPEFEPKLAGRHWMEEARRQAAAKVSSQDH
ncbi:MAG: 1-acyl-sn-glycerol-3-phosphate acyltransferase [Pirellulales bacterium]|nr:1-acyl-sn-glycerol-3-phosphate acyltransferase [Pirellulales bacterium]